MKQKTQKKLIICFLWALLFLQDTASAATGHYHVLLPCKHRHCRCSETRVSKPTVSVVVWGRKLLSPFMFNSLRGDSPQWCLGSMCQSFTKQWTLSRNQLWGNSGKGDQVRGETRDFHHEVFKITPSFKNWGCITWISSLVGSSLSEGALSHKNPQFFM